MPELLAEAVDLLAAAPEARAALNRGGAAEAGLRHARVTCDVEAVP